VPGRHQGAELGHKAGRPLLLGLQARSGKVGVVGRQQRHGSLQEIHRQNVGRQGLHGRDEPVGNGTVAGQGQPELFKCLGLGQPLVDKQVGHLLIGGRFSEVLD
jgi:hypothetical protein